MSDDPNVKGDLTEAQLFSKISRSLSNNDFDTIDSLVGSEEEVVDQVVVTEEVTTSQEPEVKEPEETPASKEVQPEVVPEQKQPSDWTAALPKEAQEELARLRQVDLKYRAESGRVPYLQRKLAELEKKLPKENPAAKSPVESKEQVIDDKELQEALAQIEEVDPVTAKAFKLLHQKTEGSVRKTQSIFEQRDEEALLQREYSKLVQVAPQAPQVFQLPEWQMWKEEQTPGVREAASSAYADDVLFAMEKFARDMRIKYPELANPPATNSPVKEEKVEDATAVDPKQAAIVEQRTRRLAATNPTSNAPAPQKKEEPADPEALFAELYKQVQKKDHLDQRR